MDRWRKLPLLLKEYKFLCKHGVALTELKKVKDLSKNLDEKLPRKKCKVRSERLNAIGKTFFEKKHEQ